MAFVFNDLEINGRITGSGLLIRKPVIAATVVAGTLTTSFQNGSVIDNITLSTGNRILVKDQADGKENGIYEVQASGSPVRVSDLQNGDSASGVQVSILQGTVNQATIHICTNVSGSDIVGTNVLTFKTFLIGDTSDFDTSVDDYVTNNMSGEANGLCELNSLSLVPTNRLPGLALTTVSVVGSEVAMVALTAQEGDVAVRTDLSQTFAHNGGVAGDATDWTLLITPESAVTSVNSQTGTVVLDADDIDDSGTAHKFATAAQLTAISDNTTDINGFPDALKNLTTAEINQLENIGSSTISATQWGYLGALDQGLTSASDVDFKTVATSSSITAGAGSAGFNVGTIIAGRARIGNYGLNAAGFGHSSLGLGLTNYAIVQQPTGHTQINASSGRTITFNINNANRMTLNSSSFNIVGPVLCDTSFTIDDVAIDSTALDYCNDINQQLTTTSDANFNTVTATNITSIQNDLDGFPDALKNLTTAEINQIENINTNTISNTQWGYLGALDQPLTTSSNVTFNNTVINGTIETNGAFYADNGIWVRSYSNMMYWTYNDGTAYETFIFYGANKAHYQTNIGGAGNGGVVWSSGGGASLDTFEIIADNTTIYGDLDISTNGQMLNLVGTDHTFMALYPQGTGAGRKAWLGFGSANTNILKIDNESTGANADIHINTEGTIVNRIGDINKFYIDSYNTVVLNRLRVDGTTTIGGDVFYVDTTNDRISYGTTSPLHAFQNELDFTNTAPYYGLDTSKFTYTGGGSTAYKWVDRQRVAIDAGETKGVIGTYKDLQLYIPDTSTVSNATAFLIPKMSVQEGKGTVTDARSLFVYKPAIGTNSNIALYTQNIAMGYTTVTPPANGMIMSGNLSIGKSTNSAPLDVAGNAIVSGSITSGAGSTTINVGTIIGGVARMGNYTYDLAGFGHSGLAIGLNNYAIMQGSNGKTFLNAVTGQPIDFRINNSTVMSMDNTGLDITGNILCDTSLTINSSVISDTSGDMTITPSDNAFTVDLSNGAGEGIFTITTGTANKNCVLALVADSDNNDEESNPKMTFSQDGGAISSYIGLFGNTDGSAIANSFVLQHDSVDADMHFRVTDGSSTSTVLQLKGSNKRVGINTITPGADLDVNGTLFCNTEFRIDDVSINATALDFCNDLNQPLTTSSNVTFNSINLGDTTLSSYLETDVTITYQGIWAANSPNLTMKCTRIGRVVTLNFPFHTDTATSANSISLATGGVPVGLRPPVDITAAILVYDNVVGKLGACTVLTDGGIDISVGGSDNFAGSGTSGPDTFTVTYTL